MSIFDIHILFRLHRLLLRDDDALEMMFWSEWRHYEAVINYHSQPPYPASYQSLIIHFHSKSCSLRSHYQLNCYSPHYPQGVALPTISIKRDKTGKMKQWRTILWHSPLNPLDGHVCPFIHLGGHRVVSVVPVHFIHPSWLSALTWSSSTEEEEWMNGLTQLTVIGLDHCLCVVHGYLTPTSHTFSMNIFRRSMKVENPVSSSGIVVNEKRDNWFFIDSRTRSNWFFVN